MADSLISKTAFAGTLGVDRAQVTRWEQRGMPVQPDGRVDPAAAAAWVRRNIDPSQRERRSVGAIEQHTAARNRAAEAADELARLGVWLMAQNVPALVASLGAEIGLDLQQVHALHDLALTRAAEQANVVRGEWMGLPPGEAGPFEPMDHMAGLTNWTALEATITARAGGADV